MAAQAAGTADHPAEGETGSGAGGGAAPENGTAGAAGWTAYLEAQAAAFDGIGERYDQAFPHKEGQLACGDRLLRRLPAGARVLDIGCGTGLPTAAQFLDAGCTVTGIDISAVMCDLARRNVPQARIVQTDLSGLDPDDGLYDAAVAFFCLLMLPRAQIPAALERIRSLLVPGGRLALSMVEADIDDIPIPFLGHRVHVSGFLRDDLRNLVTQAGFTVEEENVLSYAPASTQAQPEIQLFLNCRRDD